MLFLKKLFAFLTDKQSIQMPVDISDLLSSGVNTRQDKKLQSILNNIDECSSSDFNLFIKALLEKMGYDITDIDGKNDNGVDLIGHVGKVKSLAVQCKAWNPKRNTERVDVREVRAFKGVVADGYQKGFFVTTHYFSEPALELEDETLILIDRRKLFHLVARYYPQLLAESLYFETLSSLPACSHCQIGRTIKLYSKNKRYYYWCESCSEIEMV